MSLVRTIEMLKSDAAKVPEGWKIWKTNGSVGTDMVVEHPNGKPRRFFNRDTDPLMYDFLKTLTTPQQSGEWVRCSDRLPNAYRPVAVAYHSDADGKPCLDTGAAALQPDGSWIGLGVFYRPNLDAGTELKNDLSKKSVTHWMPLPNPPKQEGSGDE